jgi:hypothetical protein
MPPFASPHFIVNMFGLAGVAEYFFRLVNDVLCMSWVSEKRSNGLQWVPKVNGMLVLGLVIK